MKHTIALVAHDARKEDLISWIEYNKDILVNHNLICTGTTGRLVERLFKKYRNQFSMPNIVKLKSGPLGGDQQIGALIAEGKIDFLIFLADNLTSQPHDVDVKALSRLAQLYNLPMACNRSTADFIITSPLFNTKYQKQSLDFNMYLERIL